MRLALVVESDRLDMEEAMNDPDPPPQEDGYDTDASGKFKG